MIPYLEQLEERVCLASAPLGFDVVEVPAPANLANGALTAITPFAPAIFDTNVLLFLGQFHQLGLGIPYIGSNEVIRYDVTPEQWIALFGDITPTIGHWVCPLPGGGSIPLLFAPTNSVDPQIATPGYQFSVGEQFDLHCLLSSVGYFFSDPAVAAFVDGHAYDFDYLIQPGPQAGEVYTPPLFFEADALLAAGNPAWVEYI